MSRLAASVVLGGMAGTSLPAWLAALLDDGLAGVVLFAENTPDVATTRALCDQLHAARPDCIVAVDEEGGDVSRLQAATGSSLPGAAALGVVDDVALTRRCGTALGRLLALAGVDLDLAPVLDVASEPLNPVIGVRSFGPTPKLVMRHAGAFAAGLAEAGITTCGKHFPGHGATTVDSHLSLPTVAAGVETLRRRELVPFGAVDVDAIMTAHVLVPALGEGPASLAAWSTRLLRDAGFDGPIVTDALGMGAIAAEHALGEACVRALQAGADLLCLDSPRNRDAEAACREAIDAIDAALAIGRLDPDALARSAGRNRRLGLRGPRPAYSDDALAAATAELETVGDEAATRALQVRGRVEIGTSAPVFVDCRRAHGFAAGRTSVAFADEVRRTWPAARVLVPTGVAELTSELRPGDRVIALTREPLADPTEAALVQAVLVADPQAVVVHGGVATAPPGVANLVLAHGVGRANARATCAVLRGPS